MRLREHRYIPGDYNMVCDECGLVYRRSEMQRRWDGLWVCGGDWEPRHPQDFVRGKVDKVRVPVARPESTSGDITLGTATTGDGWTDNGNGTFTSDGTSAGSSVTWTYTLTTSDYVLIQIRVTDDATAGTVKGLCGGLETDTIMNGHATKYGLVTNASGTIGLTQASNWDGTVWVKIRNVIQQGDL